MQYFCESMLTFFQQILVSYTALWVKMAFQEIQYCYALTIEMLFYW